MTDVSGELRDRRSVTVLAARGLAGLLVSCWVVILSANPAGARISDRNVTQSLRIAYDFWASMTKRVERAGYHCARGDVRAKWFRDMGSAMASAELGGCADNVPKVNLEEPTIRRLDDSHACAVITHEFGHLLGYWHSKTKGSIMYSSTTGSNRGPDAPRTATWEKAYRDAYCGRF